MPHGAACCRPAWRLARWHWAGALRWGSPAARTPTCPELGVTKLPVVPAMDQPLVEPGIDRSANGVLSTSLRCA